MLDTCLPPLLRIRSPKVGLEPVLEPLSYFPLFSQVIHLTVRENPSFRASISVLYAFPSDPFSLREGSTLPPLTRAGNSLHPAFLKNFDAPYCRACSSRTSLFKSNYTFPLEPLGSPPFYLGCPTPPPPPIISYYLEC